MGLGTLRRVIGLQDTGLRQFAIRHIEIVGQLLRLGPEVGNFSHALNHGGQRN